MLKGIYQMVGLPGGEGILREKCDEFAEGFAEKVSLSNRAD
jgi:hypothetical protein